MEDLSDPETCPRPWADIEEIQYTEAGQASGANYGWPLVGIGRDYTGDWIGGPGAVGDEAGRDDANRFWMEGMEQPFIFWVPTVTPTGMTFYTGDRFPNWRGSLFVGTLETAGDRYRSSGGRVERFAFNSSGQPLEAEYLLDDFGQRIRDVRQGPDGLLYVLTDHIRPWRQGDDSKGMLLRIEPAE